jgi:hypothetical protein
MYYNDNELNFSLGSRMPEPRNIVTTPTAQTMYFFYRERQKQRSFIIKFTAVSSQSAVSQSVVSVRRVVVEVLCRYGYITMLINTVIEIRTYIDTDTLLLNVYLP